MRHIIYIFIFYLLCVLPTALNAQTSSVHSSVSVSDTFPVPPATKNLLFYVQRTHNKNTIVYEINYNADSTINLSNPVKIYWIRYSDKGETAPLSYIQNKYAYGVDAFITDSVKQTFKLNFVSYKKRDIYLIKSKTSKQYHAYMIINGKLAYLSKAFAKIEGGSFWVPHITSVEITGKDITTGNTVKEKFTP